MAAAGIGSAQSNAGQTPDASTAEVSTPDASAPNVSTPGAAAPSVATPGVSTRKVKPGVSKPGAAKPGAAQAGATKRSVNAAASQAAVLAPRPRMGLMVKLTKPRGYVVAKAPASPMRYQNTKGTEKAQEYYAGVWGVDKLKASSTNSGNLIKFSYRVLQPKRAAALGNHENTPEMIGIRSNAVLHIPTMEQIGQLRQMSAAEANKEYWMVFSNKGNLVKPGDEVSVVIGKFHADGVIVE
jgi:hypothetical protein